MELDVNLTKDDDQSWGFCLIGGVDFKMPLTVVKVLPDSAADKAGLQNGDTVARIDSTIASELTHDDARSIVETAKNKLTLGIQRGLYDPVLDEYEPIYQPIDLDGFDQPSQPTEVLDTFKIEQFLDPQTENCNAPKELTTDAYDLSERSLTASPFIPNTKPYRPFSTDPLDIPPLEDPIILNPNYHDEFKKSAQDDVDNEVLALGSNLNDNLKFKLPISQQYDPNWDKRDSERRYEEKKEMITKSKKEECKIDTSKIDKVEFVNKEDVKQDIEFMKNMKQEIDLEKIEITASNIVEESIVKAMTVAEVIKNEIDVELHDSIVTSSEIKESKSAEETAKVSSSMTSNDSLLKSENIQLSSEIKVCNNHDEYSTEASDEVKSYSEETNETVKNSKEIKQRKVSVAEAKAAAYIKSLEVHDETNQKVDDRRKSLKQEVAEVIEEGNVKKKSINFDHEEVSSGNRNQTETKNVKPVEDSKSKVEKVQTTMECREKDRQGKTVTLVESKKSVGGNINETRISKTQAEQKSYMIGLQTIPNIRGTLHSSCHYNLLLKTFFIHLTDVMVALSRFILSEPIFSKSEKNHEVKKDLMSKTEFNESVNLSYESNECNEIVGKKENKEEKKIAKVLTEHNENNIERDENKVVQRKKVEETVQESETETKTQEQAKKETKSEINVLEKAIQNKNVEKESVQVIQQEEKMVRQELVTEDYEDSLVIADKTNKRALSGSEMAQLCEKKSGELTVKMDAVISEFENKAGIEETVELKERRRRSRSRSQVEEANKRESNSSEWLSKKESMTSQETTELKISKKEFSSNEESAVRKKIEREHTSKATAKPADKQMYVAIVESHVFTNKDAIFEEHATDISKIDMVQSVETVKIGKESNEAMTSENVILESSEIKRETAKAVVEESHVIATKHETAIRQTEQVKERKEITEVQDELHFEKATELDTESAEVVVVQQIEPVIEIQGCQKVDFEDTEMISIKDNNFEVAKNESVIIQEIVNESNEEKYEVFEINDTRVELAKEEEMKVIKEDQAVELNVSAEIKIEKPIIIDTKPKIESAALKIVKEQVIEVQPSPEILESEETKVLKIDETVDLLKGVVAESKSKFVDISESNSFDSFTDIQNKVQESSFTAKSMVQESSFTAKSVKATSDVKKLTINTEKALEQQSSAQNDENNNIDTPTPTTVPPTPLTDEYVFKLQIPLPKNITPVPRDPSPEVDEDPNIVKKKLIPHIEITLDSPIIYDPPLPSPPMDKVHSPVYTKPGLKGGADAGRYYKEEILEIGRKSSLLASAIDETIKSIEEYKEQVGMETNKEVRESDMEYSSSKTVQSFSKEESSAAFKQVSVSNSKVEIEEEWSKVDKQVKDNNRNLSELSQTVIENTEKVKDEKEKGITENDTEMVSNSIVEIREMNVSELNENKKSSMDIEELTKVESTNEGSFRTDIAEDISKEAVENPKVIKKDCEKILENKEMFKSTINIVSSEITEEKVDPLLGYRPVKFNPEEFAKNPRPQSVEFYIQSQESGRAYMTPTGELMGTVQGIVDGLEKATVDEETAKELGKPGMTEEKIAALISGEAEMLREAHVMGLTRVLTSHMTRPTDDSSVDFKKIKPIIESLKDSEVLKALNDDLTKTKEEKKKEERKWTTFLQRPKRPVPKAKFGYHAYVEQEDEVIETPYKVKIVKQPKPKVAPDYKPENFDTGPLPWEERALNEPPPPPIEAEDPILVPEDEPEFLEAVDPLPESEVPDLEETDIPLPPPEPVEEITVESTPLPADVVEEPAEETEELKEPVSELEEEQKEDMENRIAEQLMNSVQNMVDPNASLDQQLSQMRAQLAALAQLPEVIQQTLERVTKQLSQLTQQETQLAIEASPESYQKASTVQETQENNDQQLVEVHHNTGPIVEESEDIQKDAETNVSNTVTIEEQVENNLSQDEMEKLKKEEAEMLEEQRRIEKQKKDMMDQMKQEQESRQLKQRPTPRVGKPKPVFGPPNPEDRPLVLTGGRKWRGPKDVYDEQMLTETLKAQAELIQGKTLGASFESVRLPFDERSKIGTRFGHGVILNHYVDSIENRTATLSTFTHFVRNIL